MSFVFIKVVPKPNPNIEEMLDPNSPFMQGVKRETVLAMSSTEMFVTLRAAYDHAVNNPELYIDENGTFNVPWASMARQLFERIEAAG